MAERANDFDPSVLYTKTTSYAPFLTRLLLTRDSHDQLFTFAEKAFPKIQLARTPRTERGALLGKMILPVTDRGQAIETDTDTHRLLTWTSKFRTIDAFSPASLEIKSQKTPTSTGKFRQAVFANISLSAKGELARRLAQYQELSEQEVRSPISMLIAECVHEVPDPSSLPEKVFINHPDRPKVPIIIDRAETVIALR